MRITGVIPAMTVAYDSGGVDYDNAQVKVGDRMVPGKVVEMIPDPARHGFVITLEVDDPEVTEHMRVSLGAGHFSIDR